MSQCNTRLSLKQSPIATKMFCKATLSVTMCYIGTTLHCPNKLPLSSSQDKPHLLQTTFSQPHDKLRNQTPTCHGLSSHTTMVIPMWGLIWVKSSPKGACHSTPPYGVSVLIDNLEHFGLVTSRLWMVSSQTTTIFLTPWLTMVVS
jgi:hypothetical protein